MKIYSLPHKIEAIIFDIDGTLYTSPEYVEEQVDVQIRYWSKINGFSAEEGRKKINDFRKTFAEKNGGKKISLGNTFTYFGIDIDTSIKWRNELLEPEKYLSYNQNLFEALDKIKNQYKLICVTNNPVEAARKTLAACGIESFFPLIIGLDTCKKSKPSKVILDKAIELLQVEPENCVSVGDRFDIDLSLALENGMGGVLVDDADDVVKFLKSL